MQTTQRRMRKRPSRCLVLFLRKSKVYCGRVVYEGKECFVRVLLDSGSQETFLRTTVANDLKMKRHGSTTTMNIKVLGGQEQRKKMNRVNFKLAALDASQCIQLEAWTIDSVCSLLAAVDIDLKECPYLKNIKLADTFPKKAIAVDLLVGADQYHKLVQGTIRKGRPGTPVTTKSKLGWLVSGPVPGSKESKETTAMLTVTRIESPNDQLKRFWELDAIGIVDQQTSQMTPEEEDALRQFNSFCTFDGKRYEVALPWRKNYPPLVNNFKQAYQRTCVYGKKASERIRVYMTPK